MLPAFVIGLREGLETIVILGAIAVFLRVQGRGELLRRVWRASALAAGICAVVALVIRFVEVNLPWREQEQLETVVGLAAVAMVTYMVIWMRRFPKDLQRESSEAAATALARDSGRAIVLLAFFAVLREGFEIAVFVIATIGLTGGNAWLATGGACLGIAVALVVGLALVRGSAHVDVSRFFRITAVILVLSAAGIAMSTVHTANAAGWVTFGQSPQFDLSWLAPPGSVLSSFTTGMFGLQPYPVLIEVVAWIAYFVPMMAVVLWPRRRARSAANAPVETGFVSTAAVPTGRPRRVRWYLAGCAVVLVGGGLGVTFATTSSPRAKQAPSPRRVLYATLDDVSCSSANHCVAVGDFLPLDKDSAAGDPDGDGRATHTLVESSDGNGWKLMSSPDDGHGGAVLNRVSCATATRCVAVGYYRPGKYGLQSTSAPPDYPLIEAGSGRSWRVVQSPSVGPNSVLAGVSCPSVSECVAVGSTTSGLGGGTSVSSPFIEISDGSAWTTTPLSLPPGTSSGLSSVSCPRVTECVAVGNIGSKSDPSATRPLIEMLSGRTWKTVSLPARSNGPGILYDVACPAADRCTAVGTTEAERRSGAALVLTLSGSTWSTNLPALDQKGDTSLTAVACATGSTCVVTGSTWTSIDDAPEHIVAQVNDASWRRLGTSAEAASVEGITCPGVSRCLLVGSVPQNVFGNTLTMIASLTHGVWTTEPSPVP